ncbi:MAG: HAD family hydrolase [Phycisphaerales bacterium]|nr:HAD family hydrolase [Phycisphaerales bacterium]
MPIWKELPSACIFDLDGTLVNSLHDIADALNDCLELLGLPAHPIDDYRYMVGEGVPTLCQRAIGRSHPHLVGRLIELARPRYRLRPMDRTQLYPGIAALVERLRRSGVPLAVLSNKPDEITRAMVAAFFPGGEFREVYGCRVEALRKPDPTVALQIAAALGQAARDVWVIGDTPTDVETAQRAGMHCVAVTWGFRTRADLETAGAPIVIDHPDELLAC